jgi:hypothetical protein
LLLPPGRRINLYIFHGDRDGFLSAQIRNQFAKLVGLYQPLLGRLTDDLGDLIVQACAVLLDQDFLDQAARTVSTRREK